MGLKNRLEILDELQNLYGNDPEMMPQIQKMKASVKQDILLLLHQGTDIMDLYKRFGAIILKAKILHGEEVIQNLTQGKEKQLVDMVQEDQILQERLNRLNNPGLQLQNQRLAAPLMGLHIYQNQ